MSWLGDRIREVAGNDPVANIIGNNPGPLEALGIAPEGSKLWNLEHIARDETFQMLTDPSFKNTAQVIDPALANLYGAISGDTSWAGIGAQGIAANTGTDLNQVLDVGAVTIGSIILGADLSTAAELAAASASASAPPPAPEIPEEPQIPDLGPQLPDLSQASLATLGRRRGRRSTNLTGGEAGTLGGSIGYENLLGS
jgi:hypothetical protein